MNFSAPFSESLAALISAQPWHITASGLQLVRAACAPRFEPRADISFEDFFSARRPLSVTPDGLGILSVAGALVQGAPPIWEKIGNTDYRSVVAEASAAAQDTRIKAVLLDINSPGGGCIGCGEAHAAIASLAARKPVIACGSMMCSAAYDIASAANFIYAPASAMVGSIGTIASIFDVSGMFEQLGIKAEVFSSGELKGTGAPGTSLSQEQRDYYQGIVDDYFAAFKADVRARRPQIADDSMRGQVFVGARAKDAGLVDFIGGTMAAASDALSLRGGAFFASQFVFAKGGSFDPTKHPRKQGGKGGGEFTRGGEGEGGAKKNLHPTKKDAAGNHTMHDGGELPDHIKKLKLPPAWTDVHVSLDPAAPLQAQGKDSKGRLQSVYSDEHEMKQAAEKFSRVRDLIDKSPGIMEANAKALHSGDAKTRDSASALALIHHTGIRPGSDADTGAKVKAYGASTLEGRHVVGDGENMSLQFTGKKGVALNIPVTDPAIKADLLSRKAAAGDGGKLFPATSDAGLRDHVHGLPGGADFKTKDFRTLKGTTTALAEVAKNPEPPKDEKEYQARVKSVAKTVSKQLGNTPVIALQSYIDPAVFHVWQHPPK